ncbi:MAG TPA: response regulator [Planctomycetota bacterium]|nr:response regulator [Planctomycetota bacterium]
MRYFEANRTILVVDDDAAVRDLVALRLSREGCFIQCARDPETALRIINNDPPDIVLLDGDMPGVDIGDFHRQLLVQNANARLLLMAAPDSANRSIWVGLNLLTKPLREADLMDAIGSCRS